jgi:hypothetical protein
LDSPSFTTDGSHLVYVHDTDGVRDVFVLAPTTKVSGGPDPAELHVIGIDGTGDRVLITPPNNANYLDPAVRPRRA